MVVAQEICARGVDVRAVYSHPAALQMCIWGRAPPVFGTEVGAAVIYFVRIFGSLIIAVGITKGLRKIKFPIRAY